jgi:SHS2 domain-containing protein
MATVEIAQDGTVEGVQAKEHTADSRIEVEAASLGECLARAAAGMFSQVWALPKGPLPERKTAIELSAESPDDLLVAWLQELLYRSEVEGVFFYRFDVEASDGRLRATATGVPLTDEVEEVGPLVKAVTRHGLHVGEAGGRWRAKVVFDI